MWGGAIYKQLHGLVPATPVTLNLGINMNIELEEVVVQDVTDDALELAAGAQGGCLMHTTLMKL